MRLIFLALLGYAIGGIPTGIWLSRWVKGVDPRDSGSGTSGATNVSRVLGKKWAIIVLIIDMLKGFLPVKFIAPAFVDSTQLTIAVAILSLSLVIGHIWTPYAGFHGGKGVATATGAMLALNPLAVVLTLGIWIIVFLIWHIVSVASMVASICLPEIMSFFPDHSHILIDAAILIAIVLLFTHRANIRRLARGEEKKLF